VLRHASSSNLSAVRVWGNNFIPFFLIFVCSQRMWQQSVEIWELHNIHYGCSCSSCNLSAVRVWRNNFIPFFFIIFCSEDETTVCKSIENSITFTTDAVAVCTLKSQLISCWSIMSLLFMINVDTVRLLNSLRLGNNISYCDLALSDLSA